MKLIHCADLHLGSKISSKFPKEIALERRAEVRDSFRRMVGYANENKIDVIVLAGDVFDTEKPFKKDKDFFYSVVANNPDIDFLYLRGNHDTLGERRAFPNLKTFDTEWTAYTYGDVTISGIETCKENATALYSTLALSPESKNIVVMHGMAGDSTGIDKVHVGRLRGKYIDYLALGHIHEYTIGKIDERGIWAQSGCLEGRGFDETGDKGFIVVDIGEKMTHTFVPFSEKKIVLATLDVSGVADAYGAYRLAMESLALERSGIYRIELVGETDAITDSFAEDLQKYLAGACAFVSVKDRTKKRIDVSAYACDTSLKGEFVRTVYANTAYTDEEKAQIVAYGLRALAGREVEN